MNYKALLDFTNAMTVATNEAWELMGLESDLIRNQLAAAFDGAAKTLLADVGLDINGNDVKTITDSFAKEIQKVGLCQRVKVLETSDSKIVIDIGECILAPATHVLAKNGNADFIPACPMMEILYAKIKDGTGKFCSTEKCERKVAENTSIFTVKVE